MTPCNTNQLRFSVVAPETEPELYKEVKKRITDRKEFIRKGKSKTSGLPPHIYSWLYLTKKKTIKKYRQSQDKRNVSSFRITFVIAI